MGFWQGSKVVIPGGAGFIGSHLTEQLVEQGAVVTVVDNFETGRRENLTHLVGSITLVEGDITDMAFCKHVFRGQDVVMNMAAQAPGVGMSHLQHVPLLGRNAQIASVSLEAAHQEKVGRILIVSSSCVYPDDAPVPTPELPTCVGEPERVNSGYGWGKRYAELMAMHYATEFGMQVAIGRPFNAYGARDLAHGERAHVIPAIIGRVLSDSPEVLVWGSGNQTRSFIHARDIATGLALITEHHAVADPINVGHDQEISMKELVATLMELAGVKKRVVFDTTKPEGCLRKAADMEKFRRVTHGFVPKTNLREGLLEMIEAHRGLAAGK